MKHIYIYRHGETDLNRERIVQGSGVDASLNATGRRQAQAFYERYKHVEFEVVITSALRRTHETVKPFIESGIPWEQSADLNEVGWGRHEGKLSTPEMEQEYRDLVESWQSGDLRACLRDGETAAAMAARLQRFIERLKVRPERKMLVCTHGRAMRCLLCLLKGHPPTRMEQYSHGNTALYRVKLIENRFELELENDLSHLEY